MKEGVTKTGFHFSLEDDTMDNMELVEELANNHGNTLRQQIREMTCKCRQQICNDSCCRADDTRQIRQKAADHVHDKLSAGG